MLQRKKFQSGKEQTNNDSTQLFVSSQLGKGYPVNLNILLNRDERKVARGIGVTEPLSKVFFTV